MTSSPNFTNFEKYSPSEWLAHLNGLDVVSLDQLILEQNAGEATLPFPWPVPRHQHGPPLAEIQLDARPTSIDDGSTIHAASPLNSSPRPQYSSLSVTFAPPKWHKIPQRIYEPKQRDYTPAEDVTFLVDGFPGFNMEDAFHERFTALGGRDDLVLQGAKTAFLCRFLFPGYPTESYQIFTTYWNKNRDPIMRSKLAHEIAKNLEKYLDAMATRTMDASTPQQWNIGGGFMHLRNIFLVKLKSVSRGSYQPLFYVVDPTV